MSRSLALVLASGPEPLWAPLRWLAGVDLRVLWAILTAAALLGAWGLWAGWRASRTDAREQRGQQAHEPRR